MDDVIKLLKNVPCKHSSRLFMEKKQLLWQQDWTSESPHSIHKWAVDSSLEQGFDISTNAVVAISALLSLALGVGLASSRLGLAWIHVLIMFPMSSHTCCAFWTCSWSSSASLLIRQMGWYRPVPEVLLPYHWFGCVALCSKTYWGWQPGQSCGIQDLLFFVLRTLLKDFNYVHG